ncbi:MAG TPA: glycine/sarcosine/betaine reductase component B subunit [Candidatus Binataceae bacterium]|nr:glycine/sarcosine/betaine reductase component B subunit [Candidatus Binataceae bacterium]
MRLEWRLTHVARAEFGPTAISGGCLRVAHQELCALLAQDRRLQAIDLEIVNPGEQCRITDIFDVFEPRFKPAGPNFPGLLEPLRRAGDGVSAVARGAAVMVLNSLADNYRKTVEMSGEAAALTPYSRTANICIRSRPAPGVSRDSYYRALKELGARAAVYLGRAAERAGADEVEFFTLEDSSARSRALPRVAYIFAIASQQRPTTSDPILYGDNVRQLIPTALHPNEIIDGAVLAPYWNFGSESYTVQNHRTVLELYRRHRRELNFTGVIVMVAAEVEEARTRNAIIASGLARHALRADGVIITKYGGGIPESVAMETYEACQELGVKGTIVIWAHGGDGRIEGSLTVISPHADALVSCGINEERLELPPIARVVAAAPAAQALIAQPDGSLKPAAGALQLRILALAGAADQLGGGRRSSEEY